MVRNHRAPLVSDRIHALVRGHATNQIRPARESVGFVIVETRTVTATRYEPLRNWAKGDHKFTTHGKDERRIRKECSPTERAYIVHSHPNGYPQPSDGDLRYASWRWFHQPYGIYLTPTDELLWFVLLGSLLNPLDRRWESLTRD